MVVEQKIEHIKFNDILTHGSLENLLVKVKQVCTDEGESKSKIRRVYSVAVELLDNSYMHTEIYRYRDLGIIFNLSSNKETYFIEVSNVIANNNIDKLKERLDILKGKTKEQLKELYKIKIINSQISDKGGAGIGLVDLARKSENTLNYKFERVNRLKSYFTLTVEVK